MSFERCRDQSSSTRECARCIELGGCWYIFEFVGKQYCFECDVGSYRKPEEEVYQCGVEELRMVEYEKCSHFHVAEVECAEADLLDVSYSSLVSRWLTKWTTECPAWKEMDQSF